MTNEQIQKIIWWAADNSDLWRPIAIGILILIIMGILWYVVVMSERDW